MYAEGGALDKREKDGDALRWYESIYFKESMDRRELFRDLSCTGPSPSSCIGDCEMGATVFEAVRAIGHRRSHLTPRELLLPMIGAPLYE